MKNHSIICLGIVISLNCCKSDPQPKISETEQGQEKVTVTDNSATAPVKQGSFISVESYYQKNRAKYLVLAEAKTNPEFKEAFNSVLNMHVRKDIPNFKLSCIYFYQFHEISTGISNRFQEPTKAWVKLMAQDLQKILQNMLKLPSDETVDLAIKIFACRFDKESLEEYIPIEHARKILIDLDQQLSDSLAK